MQSVSLTIKIVYKSTQSCIAKHILCNIILEIILIIITMLPISASVGCAVASLD